MAKASEVFLDSDRLRIEAHRRNADAEHRMQEFRAEVKRAEDKASAAASASAAGVKRKSSSPVRVNSDSSSPDKKKKKKREKDKGKDKDKDKASKKDPKDPGPRDDKKDKRPPGAGGRRGRGGRSLVACPVLVSVKRCPSAQELTVSVSIIYSKSDSTYSAAFLALSVPSCFAASKILASCGKV